MNAGGTIQAILRGDRAIWAVVLVLSLFSVLVVYSATGSLAWRISGGNTEAYLFRHAFTLGIGWLLMYLGHRMHYLRYQQAAPWLILFAVPLLVFTLFMGVEINGARRWIELPVLGLTFQTSDFAKLALVLYVAREVTRKQEYIKEFQDAFLPIIVPVLIVCGLIAPADLSTALLLFFTCMGIMFIGRVDWKYIALLFLLWICVFAFLVLLGEFFPDIIRVDTWVSRVREFVDNPEGDFQVVQSKIAIANGGWLGLGPGNSVQRNYLPTPYADFVYAIICEEYGVLGGLLTVGLFVLLFFRITRLVTIGTKSFGVMAAAGLGMLIVFQAFANIAVAVHLVPVTGQNLPLLSLGGTSVVFTCIYFGVILSVSKFVEATARAEGMVPQKEDP